MAQHNDTGKLGEKLAAEYLEKVGFTVFDRNYNFEKAEIDIVAYIPEELHFIEVKTRSNTEHFKPEEAIDEDKKKNIFKAADFYLYEKQMVTLPAVFSVVSVALDDPENPDIKLFEDVFRPGSSFH